MTTKIMLCGVNLLSSNRGVAALGYGALEALARAAPRKGYEVVIANFGRERLTVDHRAIEDESQRVAAVTEIFIYKDLFQGLAEGVLWLLFRLTPRSEFARAVLASDLILDVNEGDSFCDIYGVKRVIKHFVPPFVYALFRKTFCFMPQTYGPFRFRVTAALARSLCRFSAKNYCRDEEGLKFFHSAKQVAVLTPDLAVIMPSIKGKLYASFKDRFEGGRPIVGLNPSGLLATSAGGHLSEKQKIYFDFWVTLCEELLKKGAILTLIPHTYDANQPIKEDDLLVCKKLYEVLQEKGGDSLICVDENITAKELKGLISIGVFFVGSRMHACIAALSSGVPAFALGYSPKFEGTFKHFGMEDLIAKSNDSIFEPSKVCEYVLDAFDNRQRLQEVLKAKLLVIEEDYMDLVSSLREFLRQVSRI